MGMSWFVDIEVRQSSDIEMEVVTIFVFFRSFAFTLSFCRHNMKDLPVRPAVVWGLTGTLHDAGIS